MATCLYLGGQTTCDYHQAPIRAFNSSLLRAYRLMRQSQSDVPVTLPFGLFPIYRLPEYQIVLKHAQDKVRACVVCEDRALLVKPLNPRIMGICPETHGGEYLTAALVYTFMIG